jgi:4-hydroxy-2-oxoglutarate aldolase
MVRTEIKGIFPPITTPFKNGQIAYDELASNVRRWNRTGINGFVVLGSNGEYVYLSEDEKRKVVDTVVQSSSADMPVIVGSGSESTQETIRSTKIYADLGANAALVVTPHYFGGKMSSIALENHFAQVADKVPIPIMIYSVPKFTHLEMTADSIIRLSKHPNIIGIKESSGNVGFLGELINRVDVNFNLVVGTASALFGALTLGCVGGILALANLAPEKCVEIFRLVEKGDAKAAKKLQLKMIPVNKAVTTTYGISGLKAAMDLLGYFGGAPRLPLLPISQKDRSRIEEILQQADLLQ